MTNEGGGSSSAYISRITSECLHPEQEAPIFMISPPFVKNTGNLESFQGLRVSCSRIYELESDMFNTVQVGTGFRSM